MILKQPKQTDLHTVAKWRNTVLESLRTHGETTYKQQDKFFENVICNPESKNKYFGVYVEKKMVALTGLTDIDFINGNAELSLIVDPSKKGNGYGSQSVKEILEYGFNRLRLKYIYGECYYCNSGIGFWQKICEKYNAIVVDLPFRKFWEGKHHHSMYFTISWEDYNGKDNT